MIQLPIFQRCNARQPAPQRQIASAAALTCYQIASVAFSAEASCSKYRGAELLPCVFLVSAKLLKLAQFQRL